MVCCVKSGEVEAVVRVTGKHAELGKINCDYQSP